MAETTPFDLLMIHEPLSPEDLTEIIGSAAGENFPPGEPGLSATELVKARALIGIFADLRVIRDTLIEISNRQEMQWVEARKS